MRRWALTLCLLFASSPAFPRPRDRFPDVIYESQGAEPSVAGAVTSLLSGQPIPDTTYYGGTWWAPDSMRWEALRDSLWTFDSGVGSSINTGFNLNKPAGYHQTMEGWFGVDEWVRPLPYFRRSTTCVISGGYSLWAGLSLSEANALCFASGQGYGNEWTLFMCKSFVYGGGNVTLAYDYAVEVEPGFDYSYVVVDTIGSNDPATYNTTGVILAQYTGLLSGSNTFLLRPGVELPSAAGSFSIWIVATSDYSYSDEDGLFATTCGHSAFDNISLSGGAADFSDFEGGLNGWTQIQPVATWDSWDGDFSNIAHRADLPVPSTFCPCGLQDSVLVFFQPQTMNHPICQDNLAVSPWIDLKRGGDAGRPGKIMAYSVYGHNPLSNYIFIMLKARWYPSVCPSTGLLVTTPFRDQGVIFYFGESPYCTGPGQRLTRDYSSLIDAGAEQVQVAWGVIAPYVCVCCWDGPPLTPSNTTPWFDNISLGVYGTPGAPIVTVATSDQFQDNFATDGTLEPVSTARIDTPRQKGPTTLADTLVAAGDGGNTEVRLVFQVIPGPFTNLTPLNDRLARWTAEPSIVPGAGAVGGSWHSARMDTAEQGGAVSAGRWMSAFHESEPGFRGTDRTPDPVDPWQLENEILPDHVLTPGSRVEYFVASRYLPPDPRNPGGTAWFIYPDTAGGCFLEFEVLPSSMDEDSTWNCTLYVNHHADRDAAHKALEEAGLTAALGAGGTNFENMRFDRWDVRFQGSFVSFGRPPGGAFGASGVQALAYRNIVWHSGSSLAANQFLPADASLLSTWLQYAPGGIHRFWGSGNGLVTSMNATGNPSVTGFMNNVLGVMRTCDTIRNTNCPAGTGIDSTWCLPLGPAAAPEFPTAFPVNGQRNGCPSLLSFDLLGVHPSAPTARGQMVYMKNGSSAEFASVTNRGPGGSGYRSVVDGVAVGDLRSATGDPHNPSQCMNTTAAISRAVDVLSWFGSPVTCDYPGAVSDVPELQPPPREWTDRLGVADPNPMSSATRIAFSTARSGTRVTVRVFDVTGRLVRTLLDARLPDGAHSVAWDGQVQDGTMARAGLYFYRMTAGDFSSSRKLIVIR